MIDNRTLADREALKDILPKSAHGKIDAILAYFVPETFYRVSVPGSRVSVEGVRAFGLAIDLDAMGRAVVVECADGFEIVDED